jgi:hypothetical protein
MRVKIVKEKEESVIMMLFKPGICKTSYFIGLALTVREELNILSSDVIIVRVESLVKAKLRVHHKSSDSRTRTKPVLA